MEQGTSFKEMVINLTLWVTLTHLKTVKCNYRWHMKNRLISFVWLVIILMVFCVGWLITTIERVCANLDAGEPLDLRVNLWSDYLALSRCLVLALTCFLLNLNFEEFDGEENER